MERPKLDRGGRMIRRLQKMFPRRRRTAGQLIVLAAAALPVIIGFAGLSVDVGMIMWRRTDQQKAADAAALAAAEEFLLSGPGGSWSSVGTTYADTNGYGSSDGATVQVNRPPTTINASDTLCQAPNDPNNCIEVIITRSQPTFFMKVLGVSSKSISARAVAGLQFPPRDYALVVLNPGTPDCTTPSYNQQSGNTLTINNGGAIVNSMCKPSATQGGSSTITSEKTDGTPLYINYYSQGQWQLSNNATANPPPTSVGAQVPDPLASMPAPILCQGSTNSGCIPISSDSGGTAQHPKVNNISANGTITLHPGVYYGGLKITGNPTISFLPGMYVFAGGGITSGGFSCCATGTALNMAPVNGQPANNTDSGVTFYNTTDPLAQSSADQLCGAFTLQSANTVSLWAPPEMGNVWPSPFPSSSVYGGILWWQDKNCQQPQPAFNFAGSPTWDTEGVIYLPKAQLNLSGGGGLSASQVIVDTFSYTGSASMTINYKHWRDVKFPKVQLVE